MYSTIRRYFIVFVSIHVDCLTYNECSRLFTTKVLEKVKEVYTIPSLKISPTS